MKFPELTDDLRPHLRKAAAWMICFHSWLEGVRPSEAREWMQGDRETFLRHLDALAWATLLIVNPTKQEPDDWAGALRMAIPDWTETASPEEIDQEDAKPLTREERKALLGIADEATRHE